MPRSASGPIPECKTILTCTRTVLDALTGDVNLLNVFSSFKIQGQPGRTTPFSLFVQLTGGKGDYEVAAEFHDLEDGQSLCRAVGMIQMIDRLKLVNVHFDFGSIQVTHAGRYDLIVYVNGQAVDQLSFAVEDTTIGGSPTSTGGR